MTKHEWETELILRVRNSVCEIDAHGKLETYCGVTWADIMENPYIVSIQDLDTAITK